MSTGLSGVNKHARFCLRFRRSISEIAVLRQRLNGKRFVDPLPTSSGMFRSPRNIYVATNCMKVHPPRRPNLKVMASVQPA